MAFTVTTDDGEHQEAANHLQALLNHEPSKLQQAEQFAHEAFQHRQTLANMLQDEQCQRQFSEQLQQSRDQERQRAKLSTAMQFLQSFTYGRAASRMTGSEFDTSGDELQETADVAARIVRRYLESED